MEERTGDDRGETRRGRGGSVLALVALIAVVATIGLVLTMGRHGTTSSPAPNASLPILSVTPDAAADKPRSGALFSVADDLDAHQVVLFGGVDDWDKTWVWDGAAWTELHPSVSPPGRYAASAAYDPQTKLVMLFGGRTEPGTPIHDTWGWDGTTWQPLDSGASGPAPGEGSDMAWDPALNEMVLTTSSGVIGSPGATWVWAGTHWSRPDGSDLPSGAFYSPMWFDPTTNWLIAVACCEDLPPVTGAVNTTWRWDGFKWSLLATPDDSPQGASTMALDPAINSLVLCACDPSSTAEPKLLVWYRSGWISRATGDLPVDDGIEVTDVDRHQLLLLGAPESSTAAAAIPVEVWTLSGSTWHRLDRSASG